MNIEEPEKLLEDESTASPSVLMDQVVHTSPSPPIVGDLVEGVVIGQQKLTLYVDLAPWGTGIIFGREYITARDIIRKINIGDIISAKVVTVEDPDNGYLELSLKEARQAATWHEADEAMKNKTIFDLQVKDANKGGLILEWQGLNGFLPASQLKNEHYPRVSDGDKDKIMVELKNLIGKKIGVSIIATDPKEGKLIFSEKFGIQKEKLELISKYNIGDTIEGEVTGAVDFGVFVKVEEGLEGLVHISEMDWALVENPKSFYKIGEKVKVKVIDIKDGKVSLSIKALKENPWKLAENKYKKGSQVKGVVIRFNKHGALVSIEEGIAGLIHVSEFESAEKLHQQLELGKTYNFVITLFDIKEQRMALALALTSKEPIES